MKITFFILWITSLLFWLVYATKTIIELKKDGNYIEYCLKMGMALGLMMMFDGLMRLF